MTREEHWITNYKEVVDFVKKNKRIPSRHRIEDHRLLNWLKYNRKRIAAGTLSPSRLQLFNELTELMHQYHHVNQYT